MVTRGPSAPPPHPRDRRRAAPATAAVAAAVAALGAGPALLAAGDARAQAQADGDATRASRLEPPVPLARLRPEYPADGDGHRVEVELLLTVDARGAVSDIEVLGHVPSRAPRSFDAAAVAAARTLRFRPARRDGQPIPVRVRYHVALVPPVVTVAGEGAAAGGAAPEVAEFDDDEEGTNPSPSPAPAPAPRRPPPPEDGVVVRATDARGRVASEYVLPVGLLARVPRISGTDVLTLAPGVALSNESTEGDAPEVYLRGFAGDNGQDVAFSIAGMPLNEEQNPRTQGYADLFVVIPELVERLDVTAGLADPRQGNFALAGSVDYHLALRRRGLTLRGSYGAFGFGRFTALWGPSGAGDASFVGLDVVHSDGYGPSRRYDRGSALAQHVVDLPRGASLRVLGGVYASRWDASGPTREDDFAAGRAGFFNAYPAARGAGGAASRAFLAAALELRRDDERAEVQAFAQLRDYASVQNETGYYERPDAGDLLSQRAGGTMVGLRGFYRRAVRLGGRAHEGEFGWFLRHDRVAHATQGLDAATRGPLAPPDPEDEDVGVRVTNIAAYLDATTRPFAWLTLRGGVRFDALAYDAEEAERDEASGQVVRAPRSAFAARLGPKASLEVTLPRGLSLLASFGTGFRSPDARALPDDGRIPLTRAITEDVGVRYAFVGAPARLAASLVAFHTEVDDDVVFDPAEGEGVAIGPTRRVGAALWARAQPAAWLDVNASLTYTHATVARDALEGALRAGSPLPYLPSLVARLDAAVERRVATWLDAPVTVRGGLGLGARGARPLVLGGESAPVVLVDAAAGVHVGPVALDLNARNLFDARYRETEFEFASNFARGAAASSAPVRHFTAGAPLAVFATLSLSL